MKNYQKPKINFVQWGITQRCNYGCSYCATKGLRIVSCKKQAVDSVSPYIFLDKFAKYLSGSWQFYLCGSGEPFIAPDFLKIVKGLIKMGHQIGVMTNFSAPEKEILEFCKITRGKLFEFGASLHLEHIKLDKFFKKVLLVKQIIGDKFSVHSVARKGQVLKIEKIARVFQNKGIRFVLQLERDYTKNNIEEPFVNYTRQEKAVIKKVRRRFYNKNILKFKGYSCWSGSKYFVIDEKGDAYRCNPAQRFRDKRGYLGNLLKGTFKLRSRPITCHYDYCYCVEPISLGMIIDNQN